MMYKEQIKAEIKELERKNKAYAKHNDYRQQAIEHNERIIASLKKLLPKAKRIRYGDEFAALLKSAMKK